jgi:AcrR family transcriptional regulator
MTLYAEQGFEQTTVAEIAARAGLTERTFFRHFVDKREVLFYGMERLRDLLARAVADAPASATAMDAVGEAFEAAGAMFQENPPRRGSPSSRSPSRAGSATQVSRTCRASSASRWRN